MLIKLFQTKNFRYITSATAMTLQELLLSLQEFSNFFLLKLQAKLILSFYLVAIGQ